MTIEEFDYIQEQVPKDVQHELDINLNNIVYKLYKHNYKSHMWDKKLRVSRVSFLFFMLIATYLPDKPLIKEFSGKVAVISALYSMGLISGQAIGIYPKPLSKKQEKRRVEKVEEAKKKLKDEILMKYKTLKNIEDLRKHLHKYIEYKYNEIEKEFDEEKRKRKELKEKSKKLFDY